MASDTFIERFWNKVEKTDRCWNWVAALAGKGYGVMGFRGRLYYAHRISYEWVFGPAPDGLLIDHICRNPSCVRPDHLRAVTNKQNMENQAATNRSNRSGVRGVYWVERHHRWLGQVKHNGKQIYVGHYVTLEEAAIAVAAKRNELFTHNDADRRAA